MNANKRSPPPRPVVPPHVEYSLTPDGEELAARLLALMDFVADRVADPVANRGLSEAESG